MGAGGLVLCLTGDVMTGRGVDQILPAAGDPRLWERGTVSARAYVELAEAASGPIPQPVDFSWPWGDALPVLDAAATRAPRCSERLATSCKLLQLSSRLGTS